LGIVRNILPLRFLAACSLFIVSSTTAAPPVPHTSRGSSAATVLGASPLAIYQQPLSVHTCNTLGTAFTVGASGDPPISYRWQSELEPGNWTDLITGALTHDDIQLCVVQGASNNVLLAYSFGTFLDDRPSLNLRCVVSNDSSTLISNTAVLTVWPTGSGDANNDGVLNAVDLKIFRKWIGMSHPNVPGWCACDLKGDGQVTLADVPPFVEALLLQTVAPPEPQYQYKGNHYDLDYKAGDNDLPWLRQYAIDKGIFSGINMSLEWKDREWDMMKAIIYYTSHTLPFSGINTNPGPEVLFRAKNILLEAETHPDYLWSCGSIAQVAIGLAQAHGIPARAVNGRALEDPCTGDYCCEMYSSRYNRWIFLMPHVYAWIEHQTMGPLGVAQLRAYDLAGKINAVVIPEHKELVFINGQWVSVTIPGHYEAVPSPPLVFMPTPVNMAPIAPFFTINWWSGYFRRLALSYVTTTQQEFPNMAEAFNDDFLNHTPCAPVPPAPVVPAESAEITYPLNNVKADVAYMAGSGQRILLTNNMFDFDHYEIRIDSGPWHPNDLLSGATPDSFIWTPVGQSTLTIRGVTKAGATSPEIVYTSSN
jgi:hypothetical protein